MHPRHSTSVIMTLRFIFILSSTIWALAHGHGYMLTPPGRSSVWRVPEFAHHNPPENWDDMQVWCGGRPQVENPGNNCGVCGDPPDQPSPQDNTIGGKWYRGIITGNYTSGGTIDVVGFVTAAHTGFLEWRLCPNTLTESQACFDQHLLLREDGQGSRVPVINAESGPHRTTLRLPTSVRCNHCILQWNYRTTFMWGNCPNGTEGPGCGPAETYRGCADIAIM